MFDFKKIGKIVYFVLNLSDTLTDVGKIQYFNVRWINTQQLKKTICRLKESFSV